MTLIRGLVSTLLLTAGISMSARMAFDMAPELEDKPVYSASLPPSQAILSNSTFSPYSSATIVFSNGDKLTDVLFNQGATRAEALAAFKALAKLHDPMSFTEGDEITINFMPRFGISPTMGIPGRIESFSFMQEHSRLITVSRTGKGDFTAFMAKQKLKRTLVRAAFTLKDSLPDAATKAGLSAKVQAELIRIFSWDVDFQRDLKKEDSFEIMFERYRGKRRDLIHEGRILYATMRLGGELRSIFYHVTKDGRGNYYKKNGQSARRAFLRTPIDGARLTSRFGKRRHPILGYMKQHRGVDFAAPRGTPIFAAGDGVIDKAGFNGSYGKYVRIRHNSEYTTAYAHMSRINTQAGDRVRQGQVIGYVGSTGRSTGPHLHYEILKKSQRANPLKISMPSGRTLEGLEMTRFKETMTLVDYQLAYLVENATGSEETKMAQVND